MDRKADPSGAAIPRADRTARVVIVSTYYHPIVGGNERHAQQVAAHLAAQGFSVTVLTRRVGDLPRLGNTDGVRVRRIPPRGRFTALGKWLIAPTVFVALIRLRRTYDLVLVFDYRGVGIGAISAARLLGRPVLAISATIGALGCGNWDPVLIRWGIRPDGLMGRCLKVPVSGIYQRASAFICISREIQREALDLGISPERVHYVPNSVDVERFTPASEDVRQQIKARLWQASGAVVCLFLGRLSREKGLLDLLEAWREVQRRNGVRLMVVGPDMPGHHMGAGAEARRLTEALALTGSVTFCGPTDVPETCLRAADIYVQPSYWETAPFSTLEAMATALPIVATNVSGIREAVEDGASALLCEPGRPQALAACLLRLIDDPTLRERLGRAARARVERDFNQSVVGAEYVRLVEEAASGTGPRVTRIR